MAQSKSKPHNKKAVGFIAAPLLIISNIVWAVFATRTALWFLITTQCLVFFVAAWKLLSGARKERLGPKLDNPKSNWQWWCERAALQVAFTGMLYMLSSVLAPGVHGQAPFFTATVFSMYGLLGACPWVLVALLAIGYNQLAFQKKTHATLSTLCEPITRCPTQHFVAMILNASAKYATLAAMAITTACFIIWLSIGVMHWLGLALLSGMQSSVQITALLVLVVTWLPFFKRAIKRRLIQKGTGFFRLWCAMVALGVVLLVALQWLLRHLPNYATAHPAWLGFMGRESQLTWYMLAMLAVSLAWVPQLSLYVAQRSGGRSPRRVILSCLALPLLVAVYMAMLSKYGAGQLAPAWLSSTLASLCTLYLLFQICAPRRVPVLVHCMLEPDNNYKYRHPQRFFTTSLRLTAGCIYLLLPMGTPLIGIFAFAWVCPLVVGAVLASVKS